MTIRFEGSSALFRMMESYDKVENRDLIRLDLLKKITIYTLLMRKTIMVDEFFDLLMNTY